MKHPNKQGSVLLLTLGTILIGAILVGIVMNTTMTVARNADRARKYAATQSAADGALEYAYAVWLKRLSNKHGQLYTAADLDITGPSFSGTNAPAGSRDGFVYTSNGALSISPLNKYGTPVTGTPPDAVIGPVPGYPGWWGFTHSYAATVRMQPSGNSNITAGSRRLFYYTEVSIFQTMYFFNDDLEIYNPAPITLSGLIHSNKAIYFSVSSSASFNINGHVSTAGKAAVYNTGDPSGTVPGYSTAEPPLAVGSNYDQGTLNDPTWNNGGILAQLRQVTPIQPMGTALDALFAADAAATTHNPNLVNGYHEMLEIPDTTDLNGAKPDPIAGSRLFNKAGLIVKISGTTRSGTTKTTKTTPGNLNIKQFTVADVAITTAVTDSSTQETTINPIPGLSPTILVAANNGANLPVYDITKTPSTQSAAYNTAVAHIAAAMTKQLASDPSTLTTLYDQRAVSKVNVTNVDVSALNTVINSDLSGNFNGVLYVYDNTSDPTYSNTVRLINGQVLPSSGNGLTVASPNPIYVQGDFNTGYNAPATTNPASIDSVTGLAYGSLESKSVGTLNSTGGGAYTRQPSAVIGDAVMLLSNAWNDINSPTYANRTASNTTFNTAILGGYMLSKSGNFSGGAINYPRFLENWSNKGCVYWGSMAELFPSKTFTQLWQAPGVYYSPPNRYFNFDPNFLKSAPPGAVTAIVLSRGPWSTF